MDSYKSALFKSLISKLQLPNNLKCFQSGTINELIIHDRSNRWSFHITLNSLMPYSIFQKFEKGLNQLISSASSVKITFKIKDTTLHDDLIRAYWPWVVKNCGLSTVMTQQLTEYGHLKINDNHVSLDTKNEALRGFLINGALVQIEDGYHQLGFPQFRIHVLGGKRKLPAKIVNFKIEKNSDDIKLAKRAVKTLDKDSAK